MRVQERFPVADGDLFLLTQDGRDPYWTNVYKFYESVRRREVEALSEWQVEWLEAAVTRVPEEARKLRGGC